MIVIYDDFVINNSLWCKRYSILFRIHSLSYAMYYYFCNCLLGIVLYSIWGLEVMHLNETDLKKYDKPKHYHHIYADLRNMRAVITSHARFQVLFKYTHSRICIILRFATNMWYSCIELCASTHVHIPRRMYNTYILHVDRYVWMISTCKIDVDRKIYVW